MTADRLAMLQRRAAADPGDVRAQAEWLRARVQAGERGPVKGCRPEIERDQAWCARNECWLCNGTGLAPFLRSVELAAYCGHAGARLVAGGCPACGGDYGASGLVQPPRVDGYVQGCMACGAVRQWPRRLPQFPDWLRGLARWGDEVMARAAVAANKGSLCDLIGLRDPFNGDVLHDPAQCILASAGAYGEQPVREAIQRALVEWALR